MGTAAKTLALPAVFDLDAIDLVRDGLVDALEAGPVHIDTGAVERVATNGLFLLLSAAETARRDGVSLVIGGDSAALNEAVERLGFGEKFASLMAGENA